MPRRLLHSFRIAHSMLCPVLISFVWACTATRGKAENSSFLFHVHTLHTSSNNNNNNNNPECPKGGFRMLEFSNPQVGREFERFWDGRPERGDRLGALLAVARESHELWSWLWENPRATSFNQSAIVSGAGLKTNEAWNSFVRCGPPGSGCGMQANREAEATYGFVCTYAGGNCTANRTRYGSRCHEAVLVPLRWSEARNLCLTRGGDLAWADENRLEEFLDEVLGSGNERVRLQGLWMGSVRTRWYWMQSPDKKIEVTHSSWDGGGGPTVGGDSGCVALTADEGAYTWVQSCEAVRHLVCFREQKSPGDLLDLDTSSDSNGKNLAVGIGLGIGFVLLVAAIIVGSVIHSRVSRKRIQPPVILPPVDSTIPSMGSLSEERGPSVQDFGVDRKLRPSRQSSHQSERPDSYYNLNDLVKRPPAFPAPLTSPSSPSTPSTHPTPLTPPRSGAISRNGVYCNANRTAVDSVDFRDSEIIATVFSACDRHFNR